MLRPQLIERSRLLPYKGQVIAQPGDLVDERQVVARIDYIPGAMRRVDVARPLRIDGQRLRQYLLAPEGELVQAGQPLAAATCFGERREVTSPWSGYLGLVSRSLGHVYIREPIPVGAKAMLTLDVARQLSVSPRLMDDCLRVQVGSAVVPEQVVATRRVGWHTLFVLSSVYGRVAEIANGQVTIQPLHVRTELSAYLAGRVTAVMEGLGVTIRAYARVIVGNYGVGGETGGELLLVGRPGVDLCTADVTDAWEDRVVVGGGSAALEVLGLAAQAGARALVLASLPLQELQTYGQSRLVGLSGDEDVPVTLVLTEGFLPAAMAARTWATLAASAGKYASVNGTTHIRAGVIRPEVVVCERQWPQVMEQGADERSELSVGRQVRVTAGRRIGQVGVIADLPLERRILLTGSAVNVALVRFADNNAEIPLSNLEPWT